MHFLASLAPLLGGSKHVTATISREPSGALAVLLVSTLDRFDPEAIDPAVATLQAALAKPLRVVLPAEAPDEAFAAALTDYAGARTAVLTDLQAQLDALAQAQQAAKDAAAKAQAEARAKAKKPKAATPVPAASAAADEEDEDEGTNEAAVPQASVPAPMPAGTVPAAASTLNLFG
jgi:hypothetical protein